MPDAAFTTRERQHITAAAKFRMKATEIRERRKAGKRIAREEAVGRKDDKCRGCQSQGRGPGAPDPEKQAAQRRTYK